MRTDGELNRHYENRVKLEKKIEKIIEETLYDPSIMVYDAYTDEMIPQVEYIRRRKARGII
jgi:uncharacterized membrane protein